MAEPHEILGIPEDASPEDVKRAYRVLAQIYHPDRFAEASDGVKAEVSRRMLELNWAYQDLRDSGDTSFWETPGWTNETRGDLTSSLLEAGIPHRWDEGTLTVLVRYEEEVDRLFDEMYGDLAE